MRSPWKIDSYTHSQILWQKHILFFRKPNNKVLTIFLKYFYKHLSISSIEKILKLIYINNLNREFPLHLLIYSFFERHIVITYVFVWEKLVVLYISYTIILLVPRSQPPDNAVSILSSAEIATHRVIIKSIYYLLTKYLYLKDINLNI